MKIRLNPWGNIEVATVKCENKNYRAFFKTRGKMMR